MVTVFQRPQGLKFIDQPIEAQIIGPVDASVIFVGHGLTTGDYVYIKSDVDAYNGIKYVTVISADVFKIRDNATSALIEHFKDADIEYYQTQTHEWSSIYLPIVYKATNNKWPVNTVDPVQTIISAGDDNGYTELITFASPGLQALEYVKLADGTIWQVMEASGSVITITLPYSASNHFTTLQKYYNNYQILVNVYSGLPVGHPWQSKKPFTLAAELSLTPDDSNNVMFSVSDYIRKDITIRNNPLLYTMPLNLDFFTGFYIETAESFDGSDGYTSTVDESAFTADTFTGYAVAGKLPFKNLYAGSYSQYIYTSGQPAAWLNTLTRPIGIAGKYFDASFVKVTSGGVELKIRKYANDYLYETESVLFDDKGIGVYRLPIEFSTQYDEFCIQAYKPAIPARVPLNILRIFMENCSGGTWATGATPTVTLPGSGGESGYLYRDFDTYGGIDHSFTYEIFINTSTGTPITQVRMAILDEECNVLAFGQKSHISGGTITGTIVLNAPSDAPRIGIFIKNLTLPNTKTYTLTDLDFNGSLAGDSVAITQELCIEIIGQCVQTSGGEVVQLSRRLLEDDGFRKLEDDGFRLLEE
jgi:hypothetical protein